MRRGPVDLSFSSALCCIRSAAFQSSAAKARLYRIFGACHTLTGMQLTDEKIREFSEIWQAEFNETLSPEQARAAASQLLTLYTLMTETKKGEAHEQPLP